MCWQWTIFPDRRQSSIFASAELNFCVRNGNRWTLCDKITNSKAFDLVLYQQWTIFPDRRQSSIFAPAELNFCVRNGNRWTLCGNITDCNAERQNQFPKLPFAINFYSIPQGKMFVNRFFKKIYDFFRDNISIDGLRRYYPDCLLNRILQILYWPWTDKVV